MVTDVYVLYINEHIKYNTIDILILIFRFKFSTEFIMNYEHFTTMVCTFYNDILENFRL